MSSNYNVYTDEIKVHAKLVTDCFNKHFKINYSLELRELESKLKAAYMNKERSAQIAEKEALKFDKMVKKIIMTIHCWKM